MPLLYGEGERSFQRLQQEIMKDSDDESIFAWVNPTAHPDSYSGLLAKHPSYFANTPDVIYYQDFEDRDPYVTSNRGLSISLHLSRAQDDVFAAALHCPVPQSGEGYLAVYLKKLGKDSQHYARVKCARLGALDKRGALQTIYVRQHHPTHELETVLPNHYFNLRRLRTGNIEEKYILEKATYDRRFQPALFLAVKPSSHTKSWVTGGQQSTYKIRRGPNKLSAVLSFAEEGSETWAGRVVILLGSISNTQVGYDAWETPTVADYNLDELEPNFRPRPADSDSWIELDNFHVKVDIEPQIDGSNQLFITDITISKINRVTPLQMLGDAVANHLEPFVPTRLPTGKKQKDKTGRRKVWQMLGRNE